MIIDKNTHIQDFKLFEEQDGHLIPVVYTTEEGGDYIEWRMFQPGGTVHSIVLTDGAIWTEGKGFRTGDNKDDRLSTIAHIFPHLANSLGVEFDPLQAAKMATTSMRFGKRRAAKQKRLAAARKKTQ